MIGNDIVDLKQAEKDSNWRRKGFLDKVFSREEQRYINTSIDKNKMVWGLWSIKEAGYKAFVQQTGKQFFNPIKIKCKLLKNNHLSILSKVIVEDKIYTVDTSLGEGYIDSVATISLEDNFNIKKSIFKIPACNYTDQHSSIYNHIYNFLSNEFGYAISSLSIKKDSSGIPKLYLRDFALPCSLSISHHGCYGAFALQFCLPAIL